jgi:O-antigen/teichoic acid export membrane protein
MTAPPLPLAAVAPASPPTKTDKKTLRRWVRKGSLGLADQMLISLTNFVTMVLLARGLGPAEFGVFVLVYTVAQFANSLQSALIIQPHSVLGATRHGRDYVNYTASSAVGQLVFAAAAALVALAAAVAAHFSDWPASLLLFTMAPTIIAWQLQEFVRRVLYTEVRIAAALANDVISYGGQTLVIAALWWSSALTGPSGLLAIAATSAAAALVGAWQLRTSLWGRVDWAVFGENWRFGKWLGGAEIGYWLSSQMYLYLSGAMLGPAAAGVMKAGYVIFGPARVLGFFLRTVLPTWFARTLASDGKLALHTQLKIVYAFAVPVLGGYCLLVALAADPLVRLLYGESYAGHGTVVMLYAVFAFTAFLASVVSSALRAQKRTRYIFATQMCAIATLPVGWLLIRWLDVEGAVLGMILTSLVLNVSYWRAYRRDLQSHEPVAQEKNFGVVAAAAQRGGGS